MLDNASTEAQQCVDGGSTMHRRRLDNALTEARQCVDGGSTMQGQGGGDGQKKEGLSRYLMGIGV